MMIPLAWMLLLRQETPPDLTNAGVLVSRSIRRYFDALAVKGQIRWTNSARGMSVVTVTDVAYDRPNKLLIRQERAGAHPAHYLAVSNGAVFSYDRPPNVLGPDRFQEYVNQHGRFQLIHEMYVACSKGLLDRSPALDMVIAGKSDLAYLRKQWSHLRYKGTATINGQEARVVKGDFLVDESHEAAGTVEMAFTDAGDLLQYTERTNYAVPNSSDTIEVVSVWDVDVKVIEANDPKTYRVSN